MEKKNNNTPQVNVPGAAHVSEPAASGGRNDSAPGNPNPGGQWEQTYSDADFSQSGHRQVDTPDQKEKQTAGDYMPGPLQKPSLWVDLAAIMGVCLCATLAGSLIQVLVTRTADATVEFATFLSYVFSFSVTIAFALWLMNNRGILRPLLKFSLKKTNPALLLWGVVLVFVTSFVIEPLLEIFPVKYMEFLGEAVGRGGWAILTTIVAAPILEEILFRGIIQESVSRRYGPLRGVIIASAIFGIIHIIPQQAINAFFVGLVLGYIYIRTNSLVPVIVIHAINNAISYMLMLLLEDKAWISTRELIPNPAWYWIVYGVCAVLFLLAGWNVWTQLRRMQRPQQVTSS